MIVYFAMALAIMKTSLACTVVTKSTMSNQEELENVSCEMIFHEQFLKPMTMGLILHLPSY